MPETNLQKRRRMFEETETFSLPATPQNESESETNLLDLPPDVLHQIFSQSYHFDLLSLSLVCKSFQLQTDCFFRTLRFYNLLSNSYFHKLFSRFSSVTHIILSTGDIVCALTAIANSSLSLERLDICEKPSCLPSPDQMVGLSTRFGNVKALKLSWNGYIGSLDWVDFIHMFKSLEELDLTRCSNCYITWTDRDIIQLASKRLNLRKIDLKGNTYLTDLSLNALSNYVDLEHIYIEDCERITIKGFCAFVCKMKNLKSIEVPDYFQQVNSSMQEDDILMLAEAVSCCEKMTSLSIIKSILTDAFLSVVAKSRSPLTVFVYRKYEVPKLGYTMTGLSAMLRAFQGLTKLHVCVPNSGGATQDMEMSQLVKSLIHLKDVRLVSWTAIYTTLFSLVHNCPLLESIDILSWSRETHPVVNVPQMVSKNHSIRIIRLHPKAGTEVKAALRSLCPSVHLWVLKYL